MHDNEILFKMFIYLGFVVLMFRIVACYAGMCSFLEKDVDFRDNIIYTVFVSERNTKYRSEE